MTESPAQPMTPEPLEAALTGADDRLRLNHWLPPQDGIVPRVRIGQRWVNVLWALADRRYRPDRSDRHRAEPSRTSERARHSSSTIRASPRPRRLSTPAFPGGCSFSIS